MPTQWAEDPSFNSSVAPPRGEWPEWSGIGGRNESEWPAGMDRNQWPECVGIRRKIPKTRLQEEVLVFLGEFQPPKFNAPTYESYLHGGRGVADYGWLKVSSPPLPRKGRESMLKRPPKQTRDLSQSSLDTQMPFLYIQPTPKRVLGQSGDFPSGIASGVESIGRQKPAHKIYAR